MKRFFIALLLLGLSAPAFGQAIPLLGAGGKFKAASVTPPSYTGPGDIVASAGFWFGLRGYTAAFSGAVANICDQATGLVCADATWASGVLTLPLIGGIACANTGNICVVKILYDQTGNGRHVTGIGTVTQWPTLTLSCLGALPCMTFTLANSQCLASSATFGSTLPWSAEIVGSRTGNTTSSQRIITINTGANARYVNFTTSANTISLAGAITLGSVADSSFHAIQGVAAAAGAGSINADGASQSGTTNVAITAAVIVFGASSISCSLPVDGQLTEGGIWPSGFTVQNISDLNANAHSYWGF